MPAVTDRSPGMCSVRTTIPFGSFVDCTSSIICWKSNSALRAPWVNGVRNPSTTAAQAVASRGRVRNLTTFLCEPLRSSASLRSSNLKVNKPQSRRGSQRYAEENPRNYRGFRAKNAAKCPYLPHPLLDSTSVVNDNISPVVLPVRFPGTLVVAEVLNS